MNSTEATVVWFMLIVMLLVVDDEEKDEVDEEEVKVVDKEECGYRDNWNPLDEVREYLCYFAQRIAVIATATISV